MFCVSIWWHFWQQEIELENTAPSRGCRFPYWDFGVGNGARHGSSGIDWVEMSTARNSLACLLIESKISKVVLGPELHA
jgi:hypothetical protein